VTSRVDCKIIDHSVKAGYARKYQLAAVVRNRLKRIQYRPVLIDGFLGQTGLSLEPQPP
jgi:hypothetical protein